MAPEFLTADIDLTYNGIRPIRLRSPRRKSPSAASGILPEHPGYKPDFVFTHVSRMIRSKDSGATCASLNTWTANSARRAAWRAVRTEHRDRPSPQRDIYNMESNYNWPSHTVRECRPVRRRGRVLHRRTGVQRTQHQRQVVYINQFGWDRECLRQARTRRRRVHGHAQGQRRRVRTEHLRAVRHRPARTPDVRRDMRGDQHLRLCGLRPCSHRRRDVKNVIIADYTQLNGDGFADIEESRPSPARTATESSTRLLRRSARAVCTASEKRR